MKSLFKLTDAKIITILFLLFIGVIITIATLHPSKEQSPKNFTGIDASGHTYNNGVKTGTIINH